MLERLDQVNWRNYIHVYGSPESIPDQIRRLLSSDVFEQERALDYLFGSQQDTGDVYDSTPLIIPFVLETLAGTEVIGKDRILCKLSCIINRIVAVRRKLTIHQVKLFGAAYAAIEQGFDIYLSLMHDKDICVRCRTIELLGYLGELVDRIGPILMQAFELEVNEEIRICILSSLSALRVHSYFAYITNARQSEYESFFFRVVQDSTIGISVRAAAAIGWIDIQGHTAYFLSVPPFIEDILLKEYLECNDIWCKLDILQKASKRALLTWLTDASIGPEDVHLIVRALLARGDVSNVYASPDSEREASGKLYDRHKATFLEKPWRDVLEAVANADRFWEIPTNLLSVFHDLPDDREELRALLQQEANE